MSRVLYYMIILSAMLLGILSIFPAKLTPDFIYAYLCILLFVLAEILDLLIRIDAALDRRP